MYVYVVRDGNRVVGVWKNEQDAARYTETETYTCIPYLITNDSEIVYILSYVGHGVAYVTDDVDVATKVQHVLLNQGVTYPEPVEYFKYTVNEKVKYIEGDTFDVDIDALLTTLNQSQSDALQC
jgi:hypothetical protein